MPSARACKNVGSTMTTGAKNTTAGTRGEPLVPPAPSVGDALAAAQTSSQAPALSVIVPLYNEQDCIVPLHEAITQALRELGRSYEIVFVDDGSTDATVAIATGIARRDPHLRIVKFRRNYGQTAAMAAGIEQANGTILVTMDGDLQNDPADIGLLLEQIEAGYDVVVGWRYDRKDKLLSRRIPSRIANWLIGKVTGVPIRDNGCSLKAFRASLIKHIPLYSEMHRFIPAMASIAGPRVAEIKVRHHPRRFGRSKYGLSRIYKVLLDLMVVKTIAAFASRPLRCFALLSLPLFALALAAFVQTSLDLLRPAGEALSLPVAGSGVIFLASAVILLCSGALAELIYSRGDTREREFFRLTQTTTLHRREAPATSHERTGSRHA
jgi:glycosyltransferase involved in cell wall biosynthesis